MNNKLNNDVKNTNNVYILIKFRFAFLVKNSNKDNKKWLIVLANFI